MGYFRRSTSTDSGCGVLENDGCVLQDSELAEQLSRLRFLVLDEADRMIETGHFAELENIVRLTMRQEGCVRYTKALLTAI